MHFNYIGLIVLFLFAACNGSEKKFTTEESMLSKEIQLRLNELELSKDVLHASGLEPDNIHNRFQDLLLISKDTENPMACIKSSKQYMQELCSEHQLNSSSLQDLKPDFTLEEISYVLKQNELNILNQIIFLKLNKTVKLETAK